MTEDEIQDLDHELLRRVAKGWFGNEFSQTRCLIAVSGGADSVSLLLALRELSADRSLLEVAHFNHGWRGAESDEDERFVRDLCARLDVQFHFEKSNGTSAKSEASARDERYQFLERTAYRVGARSVVTAHTQNDRVETTLHNLFRGTGISGMRSIEPHRPLGEDLILVRPMLKCTRSQVIEFLDRRQQAYRVDSSNQDVEFKRNFLRHEILPSVREAYGESVDERIDNFADLLAEHLGVVKASVRQFADATARLLDVASRNSSELAVSEGESAAIVIPRFSAINEPWPVVREYLVDRWREKDWPLGSFSTQHWNIIRSAYEDATQNCETPDSTASLIRSWEHVSNLPGDLALETNAKWLRIRANSARQGARA